MKLARWRSGMVREILGLEERVFSKVMIYGRSTPANHDRASSHHGMDHYMLFSSFFSKGGMRFLRSARFLCEWNNRYGYTCVFYCERHLEGIVRCPASSFYILMTRWVYRPFIIFLYSNYKNDRLFNLFYNLCSVFRGCEFDGIGETVVLLRWNVPILLW